MDNMFDAAIRCLEREGVLNKEENKTVNIPCEYLEDIFFAIENPEFSKEFDPESIIVKEAFKKINKHLTETDQFKNFN